MTIKRVSQLLIEAATLLVCNRNQFQRIITARVTKVHFILQRGLFSHFFLFFLATPIYSEFEYLSQQIIPFIFLPRRKNFNYFFLHHNFTKRMPPSIFKLYYNSRIRVDASLFIHSKLAQNPNNKLRAYISSKTYLCT